MPFIAETGGLNAMFVDTTALREQVIDDAILSAFGSAGQRCSALRLLIVPDETADELIEGLAGAMDALVIGDPADPATDVGPVIDEAAKSALEAHAARLAREAKVIRRLDAPPGLFFPPILAEIPDAGFLTREVFGPILHVLRYGPDELDEVAATLAATRYGLTLGVHSRLEGFADGDPPAGPGRQLLRQPLDHRRGGRRAAVRRRGALRHRPEGRRPARADPLRRRAHGERQHRRPGWRPGAVQPLTAIRPAIAGVPGSSSARTGDAG